MIAESTATIPGGMNFFVSQYLTPISSVMNSVTAVAYPFLLEMSNPQRTAEVPNILPAKNEMSDPFYSHMTGPQIHSAVIYPDTSQPASRKEERKERTNERTKDRRRNLLSCSP